MFLLKVLFIFELVRNYFMEQKKNDITSPSTDGVKGVVGFIKKDLNGGGAQHEALTATIAPHVKQNHIDIRIDKLDQQGSLY